MPDVDKTPTDTTAHAIFESLPDGVGDQFAPLLREACKGRLDSIGWFRADWQRGGAKTGRADYKLAPGQFAHPVTHDLPDGGMIQVVIKIPVRPAEFLWNARMQPDDEDPSGITAMTYDADTTLGGYDLAWIVMEKFNAGPLFGIKRHDALELTADAAARFYRRGARYEIDREARHEDWPNLIERAREACRNEMLPNSQQWHESIKSLQKKQASIVDEWENRPTTGWIHGDLHPANCMSRSDDDPDDPAMLIDLAEVRPGHWVEDAVYLERIYWARRSLINGNDPVKLVGQARKRYGLPSVKELESQGDVYRLADIRRALLAATAPAYLKSEGNPVYLGCCLDVLNHMLKKLR